MMGTLVFPRQIEPMMIEQSAEKRVLSRFTRGNIRAQIGLVLSQAELDRLKQDGDKAIALLRERRARDQNTHKNKCDNAVVAGVLVALLQ